MRINARRSGIVYRKGKRVEGKGEQRRIREGGLGMWKGKKKEVKIERSKKARKNEEKGEKRGKGRKRE